ncbi:MAG: signal transduction histidine kinase, partial [Paraglaciecola sp.]
HNVKGLGLGLYYTNQIIKAHQGKIEVKSEENSGATFTITIPSNN